MGESRHPQCLQIPDNPEFLIIESCAFFGAFSTRALLPRNSLTWPSVWCAATNLIGRSFAVRYHGILIRNAGASHLSRASLGWQMKQNVVSLARSTTNRGDRASACDEVACVKTALGFNKKKPHPEFGVRVRERCLEPPTPTHPFTTFNISSKMDFASFFVTR